MKMQNYELRLLVGGNPIHEYDSNGNTFVEGRKGSEFVVEFKNNSSKRVLVVPSVDGLSTLDGSPATMESQGYLVNSHSTLVIPGWRLDSDSVANFLFQDKDKSYARTMSDSGATSAGVIGVLVYGEEEQVQTTRFPSPYIGSPYPTRPVDWNPYSPWNIPTSGTPMVQPYFGSNCLRSTSATMASSEVKSMASDVESSFDMGTGWGNKASFKTNETSFNRGKMRGQMAIYYDTRRNLEKRGIQVVRKERSYLNDLPSPFTSGGCKPPPGWNG